MFHFLIDDLILRSIITFLTSFFITIIIAPKFIKFLKKFSQPIRIDGPEGHLVTKSDTPTMGGLIILTSALTSILLFADLANKYLLIALATIFAFGLIGFIDDFLKIRNSDNYGGISGKIRLILEALITLTAIIFLNHLAPENQSLTSLLINKNTVLDLGYFYIPFAIFVLVGTANAVNLTDGLDGLVSMPVILCLFVLAFFAYNNVGTEIFYNENSLEIIILAASLIGALFAFLWFNKQPAQIFMGDVGSLSLGASLGIISVILKAEILLAIIGGLFVIETISVILQVGSFKLTGKRIFKMAPIHHHFEKIGWSENKIVAHFWIVALIFAAIGALLFI